MNNSKKDGRGKIEVCIYKFFTLHMNSYFKVDCDKDTYGKP